MSLDLLNKNTLLVALIITLSACSMSQHPETITADDFSLDEVSDFQREILADGEVTAAEYERAILALRDCYEELGMEVGPITNEGDILGFEALADYQEAPDAEAEDLRISAGVDSCHVEYSEVVSLVWVESLIVTDPEEREQLLVQLRSCINGTGEMTVKDDASYVEIREKFSALQQGTDDLTDQLQVKQCIDAFDPMLKSSMLAYQENS